MAGRLTGENYECGVVSRRTRRQGFWGGEELAYLFVICCIMNWKMNQHCVINKKCRKIFGSGAGEPHEAKGVHFVLLQ
jgi:hypothetical protein